MPQEVTLALDADAVSDVGDDASPVTATVIARRVVLSDDNSRLEGVDPSQYPDPFRDALQVYSSKLTTLITPEDAVRVVAVTPTDEPVPTAGPYDDEDEDAESSSAASGVPS